MGSAQASVGVQVVASPLAVTAARLSHLDNYAGFDVGVGDGRGWVNLATAEHDGHLDTWLAGLAALHGHRGLAGSLMGADLASAVVGPAVGALVLDWRCPDPSAENLAIRLDAQGYLERCAVQGPVVAMLPHDPAAGHRSGVMMPDEAALLQWWAQRAAGALIPLLAAVRARAPFGMPGLWGGVSDTASSTAIWVAQLSGQDPHSAWSFAQRLLDALAAHAPVRLTRAAPFPVAYPGGVRLFQVRGTCCLYYRSTEAEGPVQDRYCNTCPLRDDESRQQRLHGYLTSLSNADDAVS